MANVTPIPPKVPTLLPQMPASFLPSALLSSDAFWQVNGNHVSPSRPTNEPWNFKQRQHLSKTTDFLLWKVGFSLLDVGKGSSAHRFRSNIHKLETSIWTLEHWCNYKIVFCGKVSQVVWEIRLCLKLKAATQSANDLFLLKTCFRLLRFHDV